METERLIGIYILTAGPVVVGALFVLYDWLAERQAERREWRKRLLP